MEGFLYLIFGCFRGWGFPYIGRIHTAYIGEYLYFRYLKCLVIYGNFWSNFHVHLTYIFWYLIFLVKLPWECCIFCVKNRFFLTKFGLARESPSPHALSKTGGETSSSKDCPKSRHLSESLGETLRSGKKNPWDGTLAV